MYPGWFYLKVDVMDELKQFGNKSLGKVGTM